MLGFISAIKSLMRSLFMSKYFCKDRIRNERGAIIGYIIQDTQTGEENTYNASYMKSILASGMSSVQNLTLTSDGRIVMSDKPVQKPVITKHTVSNIDIGQQVNRFLHKLLSFNYDKVASNILSCKDFSPNGQDGNFTLFINTALIGVDKPIELKFKYRRIARRYRDNSYVVGIVIQLLSVGYLGNFVHISDDTDKLKLTGLIYNTVSGRLQADISVYGQELITFIKRQCMHLCKIQKGIEVQQLKHMSDRLYKSFDKQGIKLNFDIIRILCCIEILFSNNATLSDNL